MKTGHNVVLLFSMLLFNCFTIAAQEGAKSDKTLWDFVVAAVRPPYEFVEVRGEVPFFVDDAVLQDQIVRKNTYKTATTLHQDEVYAWYQACWSSMDEKLDECRKALGSARAGVVAQFQQIFQKHQKSLADKLKGEATVLPQENVAQSNSELVVSDYYRTARCVALAGCAAIVIAIAYYQLQEENDEQQLIEEVQ